MLQMPQRQSLVSQTAHALRTGLANRMWTGCLPGERRLCQMFSVSRPTLRRALQVLAKEGLVTVQHGKLSQIEWHGKTQPRSVNRRIVLISSEPVEHLAHPAYQGIAEMRQHLLEAGFSSEVLVSDGGTARAQIRAAKNYLRHNSSFCSLLISVSHQLQLWFANKGIPALVLGSCRAPCRLPSIDVDYRAVCRHAAGYLIGKGHRRIALVIPDSGAAGDLASENGFREAAKSPDVIAIVVRHDGKARGIGARLDTVFSSPNPPTALLVAKTMHVLIVIMYLLKRGLAVPDRVSLIARDHDHAFELVNPPLTHYAYDDVVYAQLLTRLMMQLADSGQLPERANFLYPRLVKGGTVEPLRPTAESSRSQRRVSSSMRKS
jgi:DNA-binding LacI/PurR family transcriptional regulator